MFNVRFGEWVFVSWEMRKCMKEYLRRKTIWAKSIFKGKHGMFQVRNLVWLKRSNWRTESVWQAGRARSQRILSTDLRFQNALADEMQTVDNLAPFPSYHSPPTPSNPQPGLRIWTLYFPESLQQGSGSNPPLSSNCISFERWKRNRSHYYFSFWQTCGFYQRSDFVVVLCIFLSPTHFDVNGNYNHC